jgi:acetoacetate decarboxylase
VSSASDEGFTTPFDCPFYPSLPARYRNVEFQLVFFQADPVGVVRLLPEPLEPAPEGRCVAMGIRVPECDSYGAFDEAALQEECLFRGQPGWYCSHVWHDGPRGIAAGREIYGTPKVFARMEIASSGDTVTTRGAIGELPEISITSTAAAEAAPADLPSLSPSWRLKIIPRADGPGPAIKQLVDGATATRDLQIDACRRGQGTVELAATRRCDVTCLGSSARGEAFHFAASYAEGFATIVHDYLVGR